MIRIDFDKAMELHRMLTKKTGGDPGIRDRALLESALYAPFHTFGGVELYETIEEKAARLCHSLISNHAFVDGNKRISVLLMLTFLEVNGIKITPACSDVIRLGLSAGEGIMKYEDILSWIREFE